MIRRTGSDATSLPRRRVVFAGTAALALPFSAPAGANTGWLITAEEIEAARKNQTYGAAPSEDDRSGAPAISILLPGEGGRILSPVDFDVRFVPVPPTQIDPASIKIIYSGWLDITGRIREFGGLVDARGISLSKAPLKPDTYGVTIVVADNSRRAARRTVRFTVV